MRKIIDIIVKFFKLKFKRKKTNSNGTIIPKVNRLTYTKRTDN
jgi:hypothetical protein